MPRGELQVVLGFTPRGYAAGFFKGLGVWGTLHCRLVNFLRKHLSVSPFLGQYNLYNWLPACTESRFRLVVVTDSGESSSPLARLKYNETMTG